MPQPDLMPVDQYITTQRDAGTTEGYYDATAQVQRRQRHNHPSDRGH